ncbi:hypothetical protein TVAG_166400 [Trichomonas vaginalis G3]|uniref:Uncharacterized protein n=1 Tax=Trichomonas vaginalis (strain ATCC PRA-98 / G3) TaxID=412133 RepID=A2DE47_TRIV3|nr:hypothetical protein TVAGG3_0174480 [Trichomonas vaginalis G3]EAY21265.1 hypothetical protein TVAG_166400 [Trichomonas vaginalis G3]KAI5548839.1 hypothetical protein TVAGG3_0174480 [Trichomonas vaginalis G3]|eukprot:XP_001582251.1 hypothetical protein [Trichomonas vaginalis G3]
MISSILQSVTHHTETKPNNSISAHQIATTSVFASLFSLNLQVPFVSRLLQAPNSISSLTRVHLTNVSTQATMVGLYT